MFFYENQTGESVKAGTLKEVRGSPGMWDPSLVWALDLQTPTGFCRRLWWHDDVRETALALGAHLDTGGFYQLKGSQFLWTGGRIHFIIASGDQWDVSRAQALIKSVRPLLVHQPDPVERTWRKHLLAVRRDIMLPRRRNRDEILVSLQNFEQNPPLYWREPLVRLRGILPQRHQSLTTEAWTLHESALQSNRVRGNSLYLRDAPEGLFEFE